MAQTLDQKRAEYAWEQVSQAVQIIADYTREAKGAPVLIMGSGLMQTLAFFQAKGKPQHLVLLGHLCRWSPTRIVSRPRRRRTSPRSWPP
jgi:CRISPR-associated protein Cmr5